MDIRASVGASHDGPAARRPTHTSGFGWDIQLTSTLGSVLRLEAPRSRETGRGPVPDHRTRVVDPGPLGYEAFHPDDLSTADPNTHLPGDAMSGFNSAARGQANPFEGLYLDDFIIGFAERGER